MLLLIDNYDSFTYNLAQALGELGAETRVVRNDRMTVDEIAGLQPDQVVISPGPCTPNEAGVSLEVIRRLGPTTPILGVCLGHQSIGQAYGARVVRAREPVHGKASQVYHDGTGLYEGLPQPLTAGRYHSLVVDRDGLPDCLEVTSAAADGTIMGLRHRWHPVAGVQFHPESFLTPDGKTLLHNFLLGRF
ncbi:MAG: anthranilate synthase component II [Bacillota bacterium]